MEIENVKEHFRFNMLTFLLAAKKFHSLSFSCSLIDPQICLNILQEIELPFI